ncbi:DNA mismatch repair protein MutS [Methylopila jiangsuensis]|uniref:DNA mismatch repair protein MutS n=1 Tax=Methylopila jiangsuensis TaxID=586230 RepID=A0A9W6N3S3_9HYPH|nr:Smr/MutS family protein [Methylopila jiangsuensis]MDR6285260.1 DNA-nicking Smr family endonuclease [Methylopila jiangsuensis]GLK77349.1 DNA mismatch repair protein MutS [Methylopila jiangsuensis]
MIGRGGGSRRRRQLSAAERALWDKVVETVTPLAPRARVEEPEPAPKEEPKPAPLPFADLSSPAPAAPAPPRKSAAPPLAPLEPKLRRRLSRGVVAIDARIDLHGLRQDEAHRRLATFLASAQVSGCRVVLVITGKGRPGQEVGDWYGPERGVLRRSVPMWLSSPAARGLVVGFETADAVHGGAGALYVRIRKAGALR